MRRYNSRKRSLALAGSLIVLPLVAATPFSQHRVPATARTVPYEIIPPAPSHAGTVAQHQAISTAKRPTYEHDGLWHVHADASVPGNHPDKVFGAIRIYTGEENTANLSKDKAKRSISSWLLRGLLQRKAQEDTPSTESFVVDETTNSSTAEAIGFNVSVETEYNVSDVVTLEGNETETSDTSTVVFTTNEETNTTNSSNSSDGDNTSLPSTDAANNATDAESNNTDRTSLFRPIRIRAFLSELAGGGQHLTATERSSVMEQIIRPALLSWSAALRVVPVTGNLTVDAHQLVDGVSCGPGGWNSDLPSVVIPASHLSTGVPDTDFILYISLAFSDSKDDAAEKESSSDDEDDEERHNVDDFPEKNTANDTILDAEDLEEKQYCAGDYLAASAFCSTDQYDRPTAGILHLCIGKDFFARRSLQPNIMLIRHELGHALGFNAVSLAHFRRSDGTPITKRDPKTGEIPLSKIECTGPIGQRQRAEVALPSEEILQFRTVRGGVRVAEVVTPSVRKVVRNHFDCQELPGAELESGEFLPLSTNPDEVSCLGDHWERRLFKSDLMNPLVDDNLEFNPRFSTITLAYFADSGWYQVDLSRASLAAGWGRAAGCNFVEETCIQADDGQVPPQYDSFFCNEAPGESQENGYASDIQGCTPDFSRKASCSLGSYDGELPPEYQYFNYIYGANVGGSDPFMDYCPVYSGFQNGLCSDPENEALIKVNLIERIGRRNSRCLSGSVLSENTKTNSNKRDNHQPPTDPPSSLSARTTALCLPIACVVEDRSLRVQVDGMWRVCSRKGQILTPPKSIKNTDGSKAIVSIYCPDPIRTCPTFYCSRDCLGTDRYCDYNVGKCVCGSPNTTSILSDIDPDAAGNSNSTDVDSDNEADAAIFADFESNDACDNPDSNDTDTGTGFYDPDVEDGDLPDPDSSLADIYVPSARNLQSDNDGFWTRNWEEVVSGSSAAVIALIVAVMVYRVMRRRMEQSSGIEGDDGGSSPAETAIRDKHKMMASIVVDMRVNDPSLQQRIDALGNRESETELSMTDTEGSGGEVPIISEHFGLELTSYHHHHDGVISNLFGGQSSETASQLDGGEDDSEYIDPLAPPASTSPVVRRRHIYTPQ